MLNVTFCKVKNMNYKKTYFAFYKAKHVFDLVSTKYPHIANGITTARVIHTGIILLDNMEAQIPVPKITTDNHISNMPNGRSASAREYFLLLRR